MTNSTKFQPKFQALRKSGLRPPLIIFPEFISTDSNHSELLNLIDADIPIYLLDRVASSDSTESPDCLEDLAKPYVEFVRSMNLGCPASILSWPALSMLAYETVVQLSKTDQPAGFFGVVCVNQLALESFDPTSGLEVTDFLMRVPKHQTATCVSVESDSTEFEHTLRQATESYIPVPTPIEIQLFVSGTPSLAPTRMYSDTPITKLHQIPPTPVDAKSHYSAARFLKPVSDVLQEIHEKHQKSHVKPFTPLVAIQSGTGTNLCPIVCIPGAGDSVTSFLPLVQELPIDSPIYGMQPRGLEPLEAVYADVESMADAFIKSLVKVAPKGPCSLIGHSFGGWIAFEMACRLSEMGVKINTLVVLDSRPPGQPLFSGKRLTRTLQLNQFIDALSERASTKIPFNEQEFHSLQPAAQVKKVFELMKEFNLVPQYSQLGLDQIERSLTVFGEALRSKYNPNKKFPGRLDLVRASESAICDEGRDQTEESKVVAGWQEYASNVRVSRCSGNHATMLSGTNAATLATILNIK